MSKDKRGRKGARRPRPRAVAAPAPGQAEARAEAPAPAAAPAVVGTSTTRPPGQRLWEMPYSAQAPRMINPALGLHNLVARAGHNAGYDIDLTLLDA
ncbi:MAG: hypothetical protein ACLGIF_03415, partial [Actinomycetes bacterium]